MLTRPTNFRGGHFLLHYACKLLLFHYLYMKNMVCHALTCFSCVYKVTYPPRVTHTTKVVECMSVNWDGFIGELLIRNSIQHMKYTSLSDLALGLDAYFSNCPTSPQQCHRQYDSAVTSCYGQCQHDLTMTSRHSQHRFGSIIASMTQQRHRATTNVASVAPSPA
jgi:hypothetical protein